jgi:hypothetical protein
MSAPRYALNDLIPSGRQGTAMFPDPRRNTPSHDALLPINVMVNVHAGEDSGTDSNRSKGPVKIDDVSGHASIWLEFEDVVREHHIHFFARP